MKKNEIVVGGHYIARISGNLVTVRVDAIREIEVIRRSSWTVGPYYTQTRYEVTNLATGRRTTFRSAQKFRGFAKADGSGPSPSRLGTGYYSKAQEEQILEAAGKVDAEDEEDLLRPDSDKVSFCNWCPDPKNPSTKFHPNGQAEHTISEDEQGSDPFVPSVEAHGRASVDAPRMAMSSGNVPFSLTPTPNEDEHYAAMSAIKELEMLRMNDYFTTAHKMKNTETKFNRVQVGNYTYETDLDLKVGDEVILPTPDWLSDAKGPTWKGKVTSLTSSYQGPCVRIIGLSKNP